MIVDKILSLKIGFVSHFGYLIVFLATFLESFPLAGLFVPGSVVVFVGGFFSKLDIIDGPLLSLKLVMLFAISGAILGDLAGYLFGRYFGKEFLHRYGRFLLIKKEYLEKAGEVVCGHTGKALVIGRMNPLTRSAAPFIVGANKVSFWKFMFFNIIGGALWGFLFASLGYVFGQSYRVAEQFEKYILISTLVILLGFYLGFYLKELNDKRKINKNFKSGAIGACVDKWA